MTAPDGKTIGRLVDVLVDATGTPEAAVIDVGGFMGVGARKIAVHWSTLHFAPGNPKQPITLDLTLDQLKAAPEYRNPSKPAPVVLPGPCRRRARHWVPRTRSPATGGSPTGRGRNRRHHPGRWRDDRHGGAGQRDATRRHNRQHDERQRHREQRHCKPSDEWRAGRHAGPRNGRQRHREQRHYKRSDERRAGRHTGPRDGRQGRAGQHANRSHRHSAEQRRNHAAPADGEREHGGRCDRYRHDGWPTGQPDDVPQTPITHAP